MSAYLFAEFKKHQDSGILWADVVLLAVAYTTTLVLYRFFFHPLAKIPGPPLAIATYLYEWYYDIWQQGLYTFQLKRLHEKYGPVIRINPDEVHVLDPEWFDEPWGSSNGRAEKPKHLAQKYGPYPAIIGTTGHELHKLRRSAVTGFFSRTAVLELVPAITQAATCLCERLQDASQTGETLNMRYFFSAVALDIINDYCFAREPVHVLKQDFNRQSFDNVDKFVTATLLNINFPWLLLPIYYMPDWLAKRLFPTMMDTLDFRYDLSRQVEAIRKGDDVSHEHASHRTIFHEILNSGKLPPSELSKERVRDEAFSLMVAGSGTTANVLRATAYHISANPDVRNRLFEELKTAIPDPKELPPLQELEKLEYFSAVIQEGLRLTDPFTHRNGRAFPDKTLVHPTGLAIPPGTTVFLTFFLTMHQNPDVFPEPYTFNPDRWLGPEGKQLEKYLVAFSRGPRGCLGQTLARAELVLILAMVYRSFDLDVSAVNRQRDIDHSKDFIVGTPAKDSPGILVKIKAAE